MMVVVYILNYEGKKKHRFIIILSNAPASTANGEFIAPFTENTILCHLWTECQWLRHSLRKISQSTTLRPAYIFIFNTAAAEELPPIYIFLYEWVYYKKRNVIRTTFSKWHQLYLSLLLSRLLLLDTDLYPPLGVIVMVVVIKYVLNADIDKWKRANGKCIEI